MPLSCGFLGNSPISSTGQYSTDLAVRNHILTISTPTLALQPATQGVAAASGTSFDWKDPRVHLASAPANQKFS